MTVPAGAAAPIITMAYTGPGSYSFSFRVFSASDVTVSLTDTNGTKTPLSYGDPSGYSVSLVNDGLDGGICAVTNPATTGSLEIKRNLPTEQPVNWKTLGKFDLELLENSLDFLTLLIQTADANIAVAGQNVVFRGNWTNNVDYTVGELVRSPDNSNWYLCQIAHRSGATMDADITLGRWLLALDIETIDQKVTAVALSESNASNSANAAATSATNAALNAASAVSSEIHASTSKTYAETSATNAAASATAAQMSANTAHAISLLGDRIAGLAAGKVSATDGQTDFTIAPFSEDEQMVFMNGALLIPGEDYNNSSTYPTNVVTLTTPAKVTDEIFYIVFNTAAHSIASHADTTATGAELDELTNGHFYVDLPWQTGHKHGEVMYDVGHYAIRVLGTGADPRSISIIARDGSEIMTLKKGEIHLTTVTAQTTDPHVAGQLWHDGTNLKISLG